MANIYTSLKRLIHRSIEEVKATCEIAGTLSAKDAFITFRTKIDIQMMCRLGYEESERIKTRLMSKHRIMLDFLETKYHEYWDDYKFSKKIPDCEDRLRNKIWICWWQGINNAPEIVKACMESIKNNVKEYEIICITDENYKNYIQFPEWIEAKRKSGVISRTLYSDLLRVSLLAKYGGIWLDSTFFCTSPCVKEYMSLPLWSIKRPDYGHISVACGYFANYSLGCNYENRWIFGAIRDFLYYYWKVNDRLIDYLLTDYVIVLVQRHNKEIAKVFDNIVSNNPDCDELYKILSHPYDETIWKHISADTSLFKLSWKREFPCSCDGKETFYKKILDHTLH